MCQDENILYFDEDSSNVVFNCNEMGILNIDLNNTNFDNNFYEDDPVTITHARTLVGDIRFEKRKVLKEELNEELMPVMWHTNRSWDWCISGDESKGIDPMFIEEL